MSTTTEAAVEPLQAAKRRDLAQFVATLEQVAAAMTDYAKKGREELIRRAKVEKEEQGDFPSWPLKGLGRIATTQKGEKAVIRDQALFVGWLRSNHPGEVRTVIEVAPHEAQKAIAQLGLAGVESAVLVEEPRASFADALLKAAGDPKKDKVRIDGPKEDRHVVRVNEETGEFDRIAGLGVAPEGEPYLTFTLEPGFKADVAAGVAAILDRSVSSGTAWSEGVAALPIAPGNPTEVNPDQRERNCSLCGRPYGAPGVNCVPDPKHVGYSFCAIGPRSGPSEPVAPANARERDDDSASGVPHGPGGAAERAAGPSEPELEPDLRCVCDCPPSTHRGAKNRGACRNHLDCPRYREARRAAV